jgi:hypothetical protein
MDVDVFRLDLQHVAAAPGQQQLVRLERLPQPRDLDVEAVAGCPGRSVAPQLVDQPITGDHLVRVQEEKSEQSSWLRAAERHRAAFLKNLDWPE